MQIDLVPGGNDLPPEPPLLLCLSLETEQWEMPVSKVWCFSLSTLTGKEMERYLTRMWIQPSPHLWGPLVHTPFLCQSAHCPLLLPVRLTLQYPPCQLSTQISPLKATEFILHTDIVYKPLPPPLSHNAHKTWSHKHTLAVVIGRVSAEMISQIHKFRRLFGMLPAARIWKAYTVLLLNVKGIVYPN